jgi:hypothetical protein
MEAFEGSIGPVNGSSVAAGADRPSRPADTQLQRPHSTLRVSFQSLDEQSVSTSSPFHSPISPNFPPQNGLTPRPPSFSYKSKQAAGGGFNPNGRPHSGEKGHLRSHLALYPPEDGDATATVRESHKSFSARTQSNRVGFGTGGLDGNDDEIVKGHQDSAARGRAQRHSSVRSRLSEESGQAPAASSLRRHNTYAQPQMDPNHAPARSPPLAPGRVAANRSVSSGSASMPYRREWAPDRSPLQKLELTLQDITKEEKRAQLEEAEMLAREARAGHANSRRGSRVNNPASATPPSVEGSAPKTNPLAQAGLVRSLSSKQRDRIKRSTTVDSRKPEIEAPEGKAGGGGFEYEEQQLLVSSPRGGAGTASTSRQTPPKNRGGRRFNCDCYGRS